MGNNKIKNFSCLIKPVSGRCNLACTYCFYCDEMANREQADRGVMSDVTVKNLIIAALECAEESCTFTFQGGEPTLAGLGYYKEFVKAVEGFQSSDEKYRDIDVKYTLQSNGLLIDEDWAEFFANNNFLIGISVDGYRMIHDKNRGEGSWKAVKRTAKLLSERGVDCTGICVVTSDMAINTELAYTTMKRLGFDTMQYIPCIAPLYVNDSMADLVPTARQYGEFLISLYRLWAEDIKAGMRISVRYFDNLIALNNNRIPESCGMTGECCNQNVIESDGSVYPCDFYALDEFYLGNINNNGFTEINESVEKNAFISSALLSEECAACKYFKLCRGGCRRDRDASGKNRWCESYMMLFNIIC